MKKIALYLILAFIIIGASLGLYFFYQKVPGLDDVKPDYRLTANELFDSFEQNEKESLTKFEGKVIEVRGEVSQVNESDTTLTVVLAVENAIIGGVNCSFQNVATKVTKGELVSIKGRCQGYLMNVILTNCTLTNDQ